MQQNRTKPNSTKAGQKQNIQPSGFLPAKRLNLAINRTGSIFRSVISNYLGFEPRGSCEMHGNYGRDRVVWLCVKVEMMPAGQLEWALGLVNFLQIAALSSQSCIWGNLYLPSKVVRDFKIRVGVEK